MSEQKKDYNKIINQLLFLIGIGLILHVIFLLYTVGSSAFSSLFEIKWYYLLIITILAICPWLGHAIRIVMWSKFLNYPVRFKEAVNIVITNDLAAAVTPTAVGGGPVKLGLLIKNGVPAAKATFMILLSTCEDIVFYSTGILLTFFFMKESFSALVQFFANNQILLFSILILCLTPIIFPSLSKKVIKSFIRLLPIKYSEKIFLLIEKFKSYISDVKSTFVEVYKNGKWQLIVSIFILFFQWFSKFTILAILLYSFKVSFTWFDMYIKQWIIWMTMLFIPTPGATGGAEASFLLLFNGKLEGDVAKIVVSAWRFFTYYFILIISVIIFNLIFRINKTSK